MQRPLGAQLSHMLKDRGVEVIFGIPGVHNQEMYRGIEEAGLTHILARHEQGAGFMADGYARATCKPGVCYVITGPGLCNIMTPMGQAYSDSVPMLVISSCLDETSARRGQLHQMIDQEGAARAVCDWSETARSAEAAYQLIDRALVEFTTTRHRPKHLSVPIALLEAEASRPAEAATSQRSPEARPPLTRDVAATLQALADAQRPLFVLGGGAKAASASIRSILRKAQAASFTTYAGRGIVGDDPLHFGAMLARPDSERIFAMADLVVLVGTDMAEVDLWRVAAGHDCPTIAVNIDPEVLASGTGQVMGCLSDSATFCATLDAELPERTEPTRWSEAEVKSIWSQWRAEIQAERPGIIPVAEALRAALPEGTMIYSDMTQFAYAAKEIWAMEQPGHWHHPFGFGTLGYALPAAIGGAIGRKGLPTLAIAGDYGFQYTLQELATAVELGLPLPIILWDNGKLGEIEDSMVRAQIAPNAVVQRNPDFVLLAKAYGAHASAPQSLHELTDAVQEAFAADRPTLIRLTPDIGLG